MQEGGPMEPNWDYYGLGTQFGKEPASALRAICGMLSTHPVICEIGSWVGTSACIMAGEVQGKGGQIYCVDKFQGDTEDNLYLWKKKDVAEKGDTVLDRFLHNRDAMSYQDIIHPLVMTSEDAARIMENQLFDFVFIDGDHRYQYISQDIELWLPKVKPGGFIGGHDYEYHMTDIPRSFWESYKHDNVHVHTGEVDCMEKDYLRGFSSFHAGVIRAVDEVFGDRVNHKNTVWWVRVDG